jgi:drug/metabolite transporter (DMT)-like permease
MNWVFYALAAALALAAADILLKVSAGKIPTSVGVFLYGIVPFLAGVCWVLLDWKRINASHLPTMGLMSGLGVGLAFTLVTFAMYAAFESGAPLSLASPLIRLGGLILASAVGILFWQELANLRYLLGFVLTCSGLYLMLTR